MSETTPPATHNIAEITKVVTEAVAEMDRLIEERGSINEQLVACRRRCVEVGVSRQALGDALSYRNLDVESRPGYDVGYELAREAIGLPLQGELSLDRASKTDKPKK